MNLLEIITEEAVKGIPCSVDDALKINDEFSLDEICAAADKIRGAHSDRHIDTCSIVNARSGRCPENCKWCAQSRHYSTGCSEYDAMPEEQIVNAAVENARKGVNRFSLVTSGRKVSGKDIEYFAGIFRKIGQVADIRLCASMGLLDRESLQRLYDSGVTRYHCNLETAASYFNELCSTHTHQDKINTIRLAREVGMEVCSGGIIGMGETMRQRLELVQEARDAGACSIPVNILIPIKGTPLENTPLLGEEEIIRSIALMRLVAPKIYIRFAGGRARLSEESTKKILHSGLDGALVGDMLTTIGNKIDDDKALFMREGFKWRKDE